LATKESLPVSFSTLVLSLASSAVLAMGLEKNPHSGEFDRDLHLARFNIDMLGMLKDKTKGNLTDDEKQFIENVISDLQIKFVYVTQGQQETKT
jgi:hypothetical protein